MHATTKVPTIRWDSLLLQQRFVVICFPQSSTINSRFLSIANDRDIRKRLEILKSHRRMRNQLQFARKCDHDDDYLSLFFEQIIRCNHNRLTALWKHQNDKFFPRKLSRAEQIIFFSISIVNANGGQTKLFICDALANRLAPFVSNFVIILLLFTLGEWIATWCALLFSCKP